jgi:phosphohistidine phosphatase
MRPLPDRDPTAMPPCELYIVRHAIAAERGEEWPDDRRRPLTERGISRFKESLAGLDALDVAIDEIFTSPLVRAKQTADLVSAGLKPRPPVKTLDALAPGHPAATVMAQLAKAAKRRRIALVGHEPDLGELAAHLIGASRAIPFKKGGMCRIDVEGLASKRPGELIWFVTPKVLRRLAG